MVQKSYNENPSFNAEIIESLFKIRNITVSKPPSPPKGIDDYNKILKFILDSKINEA